MRLIGYLPDEQTASALSDFLYVEGIANEIEAETTGWALWVHSEDAVARAREFFQSYVASPNDPKYHNRGRQARELREREEQEARAADERVVERSRLAQTTTVIAIGPLTIGLMTVSVILWAVTRMMGDQELLRALLISEFSQGLPEVLGGQVWRLITPIFIHSGMSRSDVTNGLLHLFLNMLWLFSLGNLIETRQSSRHLLVLALVIAALSNLAEYLVNGPMFGGMSGVVYGLLGYVWMKGRFDPASGMDLPPQTLTLMLVWLLLCYTGLAGHVANVAHTVGLIVGAAWGYVASWIANRR
jgi:GlpG protein